MRSSLKEEALCAAVSCISGWSLSTGAVGVGLFVFFPSVAGSIFSKLKYLPNMLSSFENYHFWKFEAFGVFPGAPKPEQLQAADLDKHISL